MFMLPACGVAALGVAWIGRAGLPRWPVLLTPVAAAVSGSMLFAWLSAGRIDGAQVLLLAGGGALAVALQAGVARIGGRIRRMAIAAITALIFAWLALVALPALYRTPAPGHRPKVTMMTALPLTWSRQALDMSAVLAGRAEPAPIMSAMAPYFDVTAVDAIDPAALSRTDILWLAHPPALPPEQLVAIDRWVRGGGRALILADGLLASDGQFPLGDPRNPPVTSLLTPLLDHWGLTLAAPGRVEQVSRQIERWQIGMVAPGRFTAAGPDCVVQSNGLLAECRIGQGRVLLLADADWLDASHWQGMAAPGQPLDPMLNSGDAPALLAALFGRLSNAPTRRPLIRPLWTRQRLTPPPQH